MRLPSENIDYTQYPNINVVQEVEPGYRLVILATSEKGDLYDPRAIFTADAAFDYFGTGALLRAYEDMGLSDRATPVFLMRMNPDEYEEAFIALQGFEFDFILFPGMHYDKQPNFVELYLEFAQTKLELGSMIHALFDLSPQIRMKDMRPIYDRIEAHTESNGDDDIEHGAFMSVCMPQAKYRSTACVYGGLILQLEVHQSMTNKPLQDVALEFEVSPDQLEELHRNGLVAMRNSYHHGSIFTSTTTAVVGEKSVNKHLCNFRIAQLFVSHLSASLQKFIGKPYLSQRLNDIDDDIRGVCELFVSYGYVRTFDYQATIQELMGEISVVVDLVPIFSVHKMRMHSRVRVYQ